MDLSKIVKGIKIETAYGPPIVVNDPFRPGAPNPLLARLKPKITIDVGNLGDPVVLAPYGEPGPTLWPVIRNMLLVGGILATIGAAQTLRRALR